MPTGGFVEKLVEMRELIEPAAAARRRNNAQLARIGAAYEAMAPANDLDAWAEADLTFHEVVLRATHNELMTSLFSVIETALADYFQLSASRASNFACSLPHHKKVLGAIRRRQPEVAREAMQKMAADSRGNIRRNMRKA